MNVYDIIAEPIRAHMKIKKHELDEKIVNLLEMVGLDPSFVSKFPHELSGGQAQRVAIARAAALNPKPLISDEPTSALDVSVQAQILNLLVELKERMRLSYLMISHDLSVVRYISDRIAVIYLGKILETGYSEEMFNEPLHPYTQALLSSVPNPYVKVLEKRIILRGEPPNPMNPPKACRFHTRCPYVMDVCQEKTPPEIEVKKDHKVMCWLHAKK